MTSTIGLGIGLIFAAIGMVAIYVSTHRENAELRAENERLRRSNAVLNQHPALHPHVSPAAMSPAAQEAWEQHVAEALAKAEAAVTPLPGRRLAAVPEQRGAVD